MTTEKDIQDQIKRDIDARQNSIYDGKLPQSFLDGFKQSLMFIAPANHRYNMQFIKTLVAKRFDEITVMEVGVMINMIYATPWYLMYKDLNEGIETTIMYDTVRDEYNKQTQEFERKISAKKNRLMKLIGQSGDTVAIGNSSPIIQM